MHVSKLKLQQVILLYLNTPLFNKRALTRFPNWVSSLHDLVRIHLKWSSLAQDNPVADLEDLPKLMELQLLDTYTGFQLDFKPEKFQKLKVPFGIRKVLRKENSKANREEK